MNATDNSCADMEVGVCTPALQKFQNAICQSCLVTELTRIQSMVFWLDSFPVSTILETFFTVYLAHFWICDRLNYYVEGVSVNKAVYSSFLASDSFSPSTGLTTGVGEGDVEPLNKGKI